MPWSETCRMDERVRFVLEAQEGWTSMSELCRRYGVSRVYKFGIDLTPGPAGVVL